jgi:hypothetical protein
MRVPRGCANVTICARTRRVALRVALSVALERQRARIRGLLEGRKVRVCTPFFEADAGTRTPDPLLTMEVLYRLSYVGA